MGSGVFVYSPWGDKALGFRVVRREALDAAEFGVVHRINSINEFPTLLGYNSDILVGSNALFKILTYTHTCAVQMASTHNT